MGDGLDFDMDDDDEIKEESEDEIEEFLNQDIIDTKNSIKFDKIEREVKKKFNLHKQVQKMLKYDLKNKVAADKKPIKGTNAFMFGDNREGKCGVASEEPFIYRPYPLFAKFKKIVCGYHHALALDHNRMVYSWGRNKYG